MSFFDIFTKKNNKPEPEPVIESKPEQPIIEVKKKQPHIVFIHGAGATNRSWNYILEKLNPDSYTLLNYDVNHRFKYNLAKLSMKFNKLPYDDIVLVTHSMGGVYGLHLYSIYQHKINKAISLATPFGGSRTADYVKYLVPSYILFREVGTRSQAIVDGHKVEIKIPWLQVVTTDGEVPWHADGNDGVVTIESQKHREDMQIIELPINHHEILISDETVNIIKQTLK